MSSKKETKNLLKKYNLHPKKYFGQNFLIDKKILEEITKTAGLKKDNIVLEIGPGLGVLTRELAKKTKRVVAIEKDRELSRILNNELRIMNIKNVEVIEGDVLKIHNSKFVLRDYKLVANIPYYITSPLIRKFLEDKNPPKLMVLMVQKEVAKRICAKPPRMSLLSVAVQLYSRPKIIKIVKKDSFWPPPKVDSTILKIEKINSEKFSLQFRNHFFKIAKAGFSSPRKQLKNNLKKMFGKNTEEILRKAGIDEKRRAETLSLEDWKTLAKKFKKK